MTLGNDPMAFTPLMPGFDMIRQFLQAGAAASSAMPMGGWVAPTVSVADLDKRITDLKAVLYWLEQNKLALGATIQALEVQKMTLATLQSMNVSLSDIAKAFTVPAPPAAATEPPRENAADDSGDRAPEGATPAAGAGPLSAFGVGPFWAQAPQPPAANSAANSATNTAASSATSPATNQVVSPERTQPEPPGAQGSCAAAPDSVGGAGRAGGAGTQEGASAQAPLVDPVAWWGALTNQFQTIASNVLSESAAALPQASEAVSAMGGAMAQSLAQMSALASKPGQGPAPQGAVAPDGGAGADAPPNSAPPSKRASKGSGAQSNTRPDPPQTRRGSA